MRTIMGIAAASLLIGGVAYAAQGDFPKGYTEKEQARLDKAMAGRSPGKPLSCVNMRDLGGNEGFGDDLILFKGRMSRDTIYINKPPGGCANFNSSSALKVRTPSTQLCRGDIVEVFDPVTHVQYGACGLGEFVPYARSKAR